MPADDTDDTCLFIEEKREKKRSMQAQRALWNAFQIKSLFECVVVSVVNAKGRKNRDLKCFEISRGDRI